MADGDVTAEEEALLALELARELPGESWEELPMPGGEALVHRFGAGTALAEEFLRTAVLVALADSTGCGTGWMASNPPIRQCPAFWCG